MGPWDEMQIGCCCLGAPPGTAASRCAAGQVSCSQGGTEKRWHLTPFALCICHAPLAALSAPNALVALKERRAHREVRCKQGLPTF